VGLVSVVAESSESVIVAVVRSAGRRVAAKPAVAKAVIVAGVVGTDAAAGWLGRRRRGRLARELTDSASSVAKAVVAKAVVAAAARHSRRRSCARARGGIVVAETIVAKAVVAVRAPSCAVPSASSKVAEALRVIRRGGSCARARGRGV